MCQLQEMNQMVDRISSFDRIWHLRRIPKFVRNRFHLLRYTLRKRFSKQRKNSNEDALHLQPGEYIRVKSRKEILETLDGWRKSGGCLFMDEMWQYCGKEYEVKKRVRKILDERDLQFKRIKDTVILEDVTCSGTPPFNDCDRSCYLFWKEAWLERLG